MSSILRKIKRAKIEKQPKKIIINKYAIKMKHVPKEVRPYRVIY